MKIKYIAAVLIGIAGLGLQQAKAVTIVPTFPSTLNVSGFTGSGAGPFGTVDVSLAGQTATITFTANTAGGYFFGDGGAAAVDVNSTSFTTGTVSDIPGNSPTFQTGLQQEDGFGKFNLTINDHDFSVHESSITFTITNTDLLHPWLTNSDVLTFNAQGFDAAAHVFATSSGLTGFVGEGLPGAHVPDGGTTVMLLGAALGALGMARRFLMS
jgi:hypothetical protein